MTLPRLNYAHHDAWVWHAMKRVADANALADRGWRHHPRFDRAMSEASRALQTALFWASSPSTIALRDKIDDVLTAPKETPCRS